jgi:hypothetical protein
MPLHPVRQLRRGRSQSRLEGAYVGHVHADGDVLTAIGGDVVDDVRGAHRPDHRGPLALEPQPALDVLDGVGKDNVCHTSLPSACLRAAHGWDADPFREQQYARLDAQSAARAVKPWAGGGQLA